MHDHIYIYIYIYIIIKKKLIGLLHYEFISPAYHLVLQMVFEQKYDSFCLNLVNTFNPKKDIQWVITYLSIYLYKSRYIYIYIHMLAYLGLEYLPIYNR